MSDNTVQWFEVATADADGAEEFYGSLFGWTFSSDPDSVDAGMDYRMITYPGQQQPSGGLFATGGKSPDHAVFTVAVPSVADTCAAAEKLGGTVVFSQTEPTAGPAFAYVQDRSGNLFGIFTPAAKS